MNARPSQAENSLINNNSTQSQKVKKFDGIPLIRRNSKTSRDTFNTTNPLQLEKTNSNSSQKWKMIPRKLKAIGQASVQRKESLSQKDLVTADLRLLNEEALNLAKDVGIEPGEEMTKYKWFIELMVEKALPYGWIKEIDPNGKIVYFDSFENVSCFKHPYLMQYRDAFSEILKIEEEINKDSFFSNLKAGKKSTENEEKIRTKKNQKRTHKLSPQPKNSRIAEGHSTSPLKRVIGVFQKIDRGKKEQEVPLQNENMLFHVEDNRIQQIHKHFQERETELVKSSSLRMADLDETDFFLLNYRQFYIKLFFPHLSGDWLNLFDYVEKNYHSYRSAQVAEVLQAIILLMIPINKPHLFWIARVYCSLELPDECEKKKILIKQEDKIVYVNRMTNIYITAHPSFLFIKELLKYVDFVVSKQETIAEKFSSVQVFYNHFENPIRINMQDEINEYLKIENANKKKTIIGSVMPKVKNKLRLLKFHQDLSKENTGLMKRLSRRLSKLSVAEQNAKAKRENIESTEKETEEQSNEEDHLDVFNLPKDDKDPKENRDYHILEIAKQLELDLTQNVHLLIFINEFIDVKSKREKDHRWEFRVISGGNGYWINHIEKRAVREYPYLKELKSVLKAYNKEVVHEHRRTLKLKKMHKIMRHFVIEDYKKIKGLLNMEAKEFVKWNMLDNNSGKSKREPYNLKFIKKFLKAESTNMEEIKELLFSCMFDLQKKNRKKKKKNQQILVNFENDNDAAIKKKDDSLMFHMLNKAGVTLDEIWSDKNKIEEGKNPFDLEKDLIDEEVLDKNLKEKVQRIVREMVENDYASLKPEYGKELLDMVEHKIDYIMDNVLSDNEENLSDEEEGKNANAKKIKGNEIKTNQSAEKETMRKQGIEIDALNKEPNDNKKPEGLQNEVPKNPLEKLNFLLKKSPQRFANYSDLSTRNITKLKDYISKSFQSKFMEKFEKNSLPIEMVFKDEAELSVPKTKLLPRPSALPKLSLKIAQEFNPYKMQSDSSSSPSTSSSSSSASGSSSKISEESDSKSSEDSEGSSGGGSSEQESSDEQVSASEEGEEEESLASSGADDDNELLVKKEEVIKSVIKMGEEIMSKIVLKDDDVKGKEPQDVMKKVAEDGVRKDSEGTARKGAEAKARKESSGKVQKETAGSVKKKPAGAVRKEPAGAVKKEPAGAVKQELTNAAKKEPASQELTNAAKKGTTSQELSNPVKKEPAIQELANAAKKEYARHSNLNESRKNSKTGNQEGKNETNNNNIQINVRAASNGFNITDERINENVHRNSALPLFDSPLDNIRKSKRAQTTVGGSVVSNNDDSKGNPGKIKGQKIGPNLKEEKQESKQSSDEKAADFRRGLKDEVAQNEEIVSKDEKAQVSAAVEENNKILSAEENKEKYEKRKKKKKTTKRENAIPVKTVNHDSINAKDETISAPMKEEVVINLNQRNLEVNQESESQLPIEGIDILQGNLDENSGLQNDSKEERDIKREKKHKRKKKHKKRTKHLKIKDETNLNENKADKEGYLINVIQAIENQGKGTYSSQSQRERYLEDNQDFENVTSIKNLKLMDSDNQERRPSISRSASSAKEDLSRQKLLELISNDINNNQNNDKLRFPKKEISIYPERNPLESKEEALTRIRNFLNQKNSPILQPRNQNDFTLDEDFRNASVEGYSPLKRKGDIPLDYRNRMSPLPQIKSPFASIKNIIPYNPSTKYLNRSPRFRPDKRLERYLNQIDQDEGTEKVLKLPFIGVGKHEASPVISTQLANLQISGIAVGMGDKNNEYNKKHKKQEKKKKKKGLDSDFLIKLKRLTILIAEKNAKNREEYSSPPMEFKDLNLHQGTPGELKKSRNLGHIHHEEIEINKNTDEDDFTGDRGKMLIVEPIKMFSPRSPKRLLQSPTRSPIRTPTTLLPKLKPRNDKDSDMNREGNSAFIPARSPLKALSAYLGNKKADI